MQETQGIGGGHAGESLTVIAYVFVASTLFYALRTRSTAYQHWVDVSQMLCWGEFFLAHVGYMLAGGRLRERGAPYTVTTVDLVVGAMVLGLLLLSAYLFLDAPIQILTYGGLLAGRVWTAMTASRSELVFFQIRSGVALVSIIAVLAIAWQQSGGDLGPPYLIAALAWYFVIHAVTEIVLMLVRAMLHRSIA